MEEYGQFVATLGKKEPRDFYEDRQYWVRCLQTLDRHRGSHKTIVLYLHGAFTDATMYTRNVLRLILQQLGIECYSKGCLRVAIFTHGQQRKTWIHECIADTMFVIEAQLLAMLPANVATPKRLQQLFCKLFRGVRGAKIHVLNSKQLKSRGFGLITAVGQGAQSPPCMVVVERHGHGAEKLRKSVAIVGKGVTFDSGGMALKPPQHLMKMKYDKIGAVYAAYATYQMMQDPALQQHTILGVFPLAENAISGKAIHSGDVVKSYIGKTVEITDPDAEGRLLLADAFGLLHSYKPDVVLDIATLTGHAQIIHCDHSGYFYASSEAWKRDIEKASFALGERMVAMPTWTSGYAHVLKSPVADLVNFPANKECSSSSFVATLFLKEFLPKDCDWLHIDLAHEIDGAVPIGHGIRTLIHATHSWLRKN
jgi:leucyl aminopeptidase